MEYRRQVGGGGGLVRRRGQLPPRPVGQGAPPPSAPPPPRLPQPLARAPQVAGQPHRVGGHAGLAPVGIEATAFRVVRSQAN